MSKKWFVLSIILFGLIVNGFNFIVRSEDIKPVMVSESDFNLSSYKEKAEVNDSHVLEISYDKNKISLVKSDVSYKLVGSDSDISIFNDCVDVSYKVENGKISFTGQVKKWGVYRVDIQPVIKNSLTLSKYAWWESSWSKRIALTTSASQTPGNLINFPVLVMINATVSSAIGADGDSLRFVASDNITEYYYQFDNIWNDSGVNYVWVNITSLSSSGTTFYMYYDNVLAANKSSVYTWDSNYVYVCHASNFTDSGIYGYDGTEVGSIPVVQGKIGDALDFDGSNDYISMANGAWLSTTGCAGDFGTYEIWAEPDVTNADMTLIGQRDTDSNNGDPNGLDQCYIRLRSTAGTRVAVDSGCGGYNEVYVDSIGSYSTSYQYFTTQLRVDNALLKKDTALVYSDTSCFMSEESVAKRSGYNIGASFDSNHKYNGELDEIRISNIYRSNEWLITCYNTINNVTGVSPFISFGSEEVYPSPSANVLPNVSSISFVNNSADVGICSNFSFNVYDENGDTITFTVEGNHDLCSINGNMLNGTLWFNCTNCKWLGYNYTIWLNLTDDNVSYHRYWFEFRTEECCFSLGDDMEINIELSQLVMLLLLGCWLFFTSLYYNSRQRNEVILAWVQFCFAMPLSFVIGGLVAPYVMGYAVAVIIPLLSLVILVDAMLSR